VATILCQSLLKAATGKEALYVVRTIETKSRVGQESNEPSG
jgi:hypothetical protein